MNALVNPHLEDSAVLDKCTEYSSRERDGEYLFIDSKSGRWIRSNATGAYILQMIDGKRSIRDILEQLSSEYELPQGDIADVIRSFFTDLVASGFGWVVNTGNGEPACGECGKPDVSMRSKIPGSLWIHPWPTCNLSCPNCHDDGGSDSTERLTAADLASFFDYIRQTADKPSLPTLMVAGDEPLMYFEELLDILEHSRGAFCHTVMLTNGTVGSREQWSRLLPLLDGVQVSLDGATAETNDRIRSQGSFDRTVNTIRLIRNLSDSFFIAVSFTPTMLNYREYCESANMVGLATELGVDGIRVGSLVPVGRAKDTKELVVGKAQLNEVAAKTLRAYARASATLSVFGPCTRALNVEVGDACMPKIALAGRRTSCGAGLPTLSISHDGTVYPCVSIADSRHVLGNVKSSCPAEICRAAAQITESWSLDHQPFCANCEVRYVCGGGCRAVALAVNGDPLSPDPRYKGPESDDCLHKKDLLEAMWKSPDYQVLRQFGPIGKRGEVMLNLGGRFPR